MSKELQRVSHGNAIKNEKKILKTDRIHKM